MRTTDNKVVLFADLLGFAALTEEHPLDLDLIEASERPLSWNLDRIVRLNSNPLTRAFTSFHHSLRSVTDLSKMSHPMTAITFSDSAFIATSHLFEAANWAINLVQMLLPQRVPLRVGIAFGSFEAVRFRSDVTRYGGDHAAHFLGTGVVRSHATESCGIKGVRLLLHPSAAALLDDPLHNPPLSDMNRFRYVECAAEESSNSAGVRNEIDYWNFKPTAESQAWHAVQDMWDTAPHFALKHYQATAEAINRMRINQGEPPLKNLRHRTLPHRRAQR